MRGLGLGGLWGPPDVYISDTIQKKQKQKKRTNKKKKKTKKKAKTMADRFLNAMLSSKETTAKRKKSILTLNPECTPDEPASLPDASNPLSEPSSLPDAFLVLPEKTDKLCPNEQEIIYLRLGSAGPLARPADSVGKLGQTRPPGWRPGAPGCAR